MWGSLGPSPLASPQPLGSGPARSARAAVAVSNGVRYWRRPVTREAGSFEPPISEPDPSPLAHPQPLGSGPARSALATVAESSGIC